MLIPVRPSTKPSAASYPQERRFAALFAASLKHPVPPSVVGEKVVEIVESGTWQLRHPVGPDAVPFLQSVFVYGIYLIVLGVTLILIPNTLLGILGIPPTTEVYIRILGAVVLGIALYYVAAARQEVAPFFRWTVWGRALVLTGATWTALTLRAPRSAA